MRVFNYLLARHERHAGQPLLMVVAVSMSLSWSVRKIKVRVRKIEGAARMKGKRRMGSNLCARDSLVQ